jgi:hypothetical protein
MRRIIFIVLGIVLLLGIGVGIYFGFLQGNAKLSGAPGTSFPDSGKAAPDTSAGTPSTQELGVAAPNAGTDIAPHLVRVSDRPVALGFATVFVPPQKIGTSTASTTATYSDPDVRVEYVERESGNIYAYQAHGRTLTRLTNKTLPGIEYVSWLSDGSLAYAQFLSKTGSTEQVSTYALPANGSDGYFLNANLAQVLTRATSTLVTLLSTTDGSSASASSPSGTGLHTLFSSPLASLVLGFSGTNYVATTKGSAHADGYAFQVDGKTGAFTRILGPLPGLATLPSPNGHYLLYTYNADGHMALAVLDMTTHIATRLPLATLAQKCVWTEDSSAVYCGVPTSMTGTLPDEWYQGATSFSDRIWKIDMTGRVATLIIDPKRAANVDVDAVGLSLDRMNDVLVFENRNDGLLYAYDL